MGKTLHRARGLVHDLIVTKNGRIVTLWSQAGIRHTVYDSATPHLPGLEYARNMLAALAFCPQARSCLVLGLGGGSIPRMLLAARPHLEVEAIEIDPVVVVLAEKYFETGSLPRLRIHQEDAAAFLRRGAARYSMLVLDTYVGERFPDQCASKEFIEDARKSLLDDGVLALNWLGGNSQIRRELLANLESIIGPVWQLPGLTSRNYLYFASTKGTTRPDIIAAAAALESDIPFENSIRQLVHRISQINKWKG
jgi:spermidine synthase